MTEFAESILFNLASREGWQLDSLQAPTLVRWDAPDDLDIKVRVDGLNATVTADGITVTVDLVGCESVDDAVMRIEEESQHIAG